MRLGTKETGDKGEGKKKLVSNMFLFDEGSNVGFLISKLEKSAHDSTHLRVKNMYLYLGEFISLSRIFLPTDLRISKYFFFEISLHPGWYVAFVRW